MEPRGSKGATGLVYEGQQQLQLVIRQQSIHHQFTGITLPFREGNRQLRFSGFEDPPIKVFFQIPSPLAIS
jgi:hypothetical protein